MFIVIFFDSTYGDNAEIFDSYNNAKSFWDDYKDTPTCDAGMMVYTKGQHIVKIDSFFKFPIDK